MTETDEHEVFWFRLESGDRLQEKRLPPRKVQIVEWEAEKPVYRWADYFRLKNQFAAVIERVKPDVIHAGPIQRIAFLAALNDFHPLISMSWGFDMLQDADRNILWKEITRYVLKKSDWLIADCDTVRQKVVHFGFSPEKVTVFPWGVDVGLFSPEVRKKARKTIGFEDKFVVVHTRSWENRYGVDIALGGLHLALKENPNIHMFLFSGGSLKEEIRKFINKNEMAENVHFYGYQENEQLIQYFRAGDVYLSASHVDGSSVALLEAMACGCVPLVSDIPSNKEWVIDDENGWTFSDGSAQELAQKLVIASQEDLKRKEILSRQKIEADADWKKGTQKLLKTYRDVVTLYRENRAVR